MSAPDDSTIIGRDASDELRRQIAPLLKVRDTLTAFGSSPIGFVLGAVLSTLLGGLEAITVAVLDSIRVVFVGTGPGTTGTLGVADLPLLLGEVLFATTGMLGLRLQFAVSAAVGSLIDVTEAFGPLQPVAFAALVAGIGIVVAWAARLAIEIVLDAVPGGGAFIN